MFSTLAISSLGCAIEDKTAFGAPYTIAAEPAPRVESGALVFTATYLSVCASGVSEFEVRRFGEDVVCAPAILQTSCMLVAYRHEPECASPLPFEEEVTMEIHAPLPESAEHLAEKTLACPPGSLYAMVKLSDAAAAPLGGKKPSLKPPFVAGLSTQTPHSTKPLEWDDEEDEEEDGHWEPPAAAAAASFKDDSVGSDDPEEEATRVVNELATQTAEDSVNFLRHCEAQRAADEPSACCTDRMVTELRRKVATEAAAADANASASDASGEARVAIDAVGGAAALGGAPVAFSA